MEYCILNQTDHFSKLDFFLFRFFKNKRIFKKMQKSEENINLFAIPLPENLKEKQKKRYCIGVCKYLKKCGIKKICFGTIKDTLFKESLKKEFDIFSGKEVFEKEFFNVLDFFANKKGILLKESEICFICNNPDVFNQYVLKCIKKVKKITVFTKNPDSFIKIQEEIRKTYGMMISFNGNVKKYNKIYINLEEKPVFSAGFFKSVHMIDIFSIYKNAYNEILFFAPTEKAEILKENGLHKTIRIVEYLDNYTNLLKGKNKKIVNITKID